MTPSPNAHEPDFERLLEHLDLDTSGLDDAIRDLDALPADAAEPLPPERIDQLVAQAVPAPRRGLLQFVRLHVLAASLIGALVLTAAATVTTVTLIWPERTNHIETLTLERCYQLMVAPEQPSEDRVGANVLVGGRVRYTLLVLNRIAADGRWEPETAAAARSALDELRTAWTSDPATPGPTETPDCFMALALQAEDDAQPAVVRRACIRELIFYTRIAFQALREFEPLNKIERTTKERIASKIVDALK